MDTIKTYFVEVALKKLVPMAVMGSITALCSLMAAHHGLLSGMGIDFDPNDQTIDISLKVLQGWMIVFLGGAVTAGIAWFKHHTMATIAGLPQSGDMRTSPSQPMEGGNRKTDPKS